MKVVVAPQAFKGTASAAVAAEAMRRGVLQAMPDAEVISAPIADGGSGTVEALVAATGGRYVDSPACDPLGRPIAARWGVLGDGETAVIEIAAASGLSLLSASERDPTRTTSRGAGMLLRAALDDGYRRILVGLGDSATNDAGVGLAQAIGVQALNAPGQEIPAGGTALADLVSFGWDTIHAGLASARITALCDVTIPLCGPEGSSAIFGPQKGASPQQVALLDAALARFADVVEKQLGRNVREIPGAGAAGGLGAGLMVFCNAELRPGFEVVSETLQLEQTLWEADLVLTGEGRIDAQTARGKGVGSIATLAKRCGVPMVAAIVGSDTLGQGQAASLGLDGVFALVGPPDMPVIDPVATPHLIEEAAARAVANLIKGEVDDR